MFCVCVAACPLIPCSNMPVSVSVGSSLCLIQRRHSIRVWACHRKSLWGMRFSRCFFLAVTLCSAFSVCAQTAVDMLVERLTELAVEGLGEDFDLSDFADRLYDYQQHPIDLNRTDGSELRELQFVPQLFIDNLLDHRRRSGAFVAIQELQAIDGLDAELLRLLLPYVTVRDKSPLANVGMRELLRTGSHELMVRYGRTVQQRQGYAVTDTGRSRYLGSPDQLFVRYRYRYGN